MICFVVAMEKEALPLLKDEEVKVESESVLGYAKVYEASVEGKRFLLAATGIGKCFSAAGIASLKTKYPEIEAFINIGIAGSLDPFRYPLLSVLIGSEFVQHDFDTTAFGDRIGQLPGINIVHLPSSEHYNRLAESAVASMGLKCERGLIASGDQFIAEPSQIKRIKDHFNAVAMDMESAAFAQIAYVFRIPFSCVRVISDTGQKGEYEKYSVSAAEKVCLIAKSIVKNQEEKR